MIFPNFERKKFPNVYGTKIKILINSVLPIVLGETSDLVEIIFVSLGKIFNREKTNKNIIFSV